MAKIKYYLAMVFGALLALLAIQNMASVELNFLFWSFQASRIVIIVFALFTGFLMGWVYGSHKRFGSNK